MAIMEPQGAYAPAAERPADLVSENSLHRLFIWSIVFKAVQSAAEVAVGIAAIFVAPAFVLGAAQMIVEWGLLGSPTWFPARLTMEFARDFAADGQLLAVIYLLSHGLSKLALVIALAKGKLWSYPAFAWLMAIFIGTQMVSFASSHEPLLIVLSLFDALVLWLTMHEYHRVKHLPRFR